MYEVQTPLFMFWSNMIPDDSFVLALKPGEKVPDPAKNPNGTKDAQLVKPGKTPNGNYGIRLDGQYIVVDIDCDNPDREAFEASLPPTWSQRTARTDVVGMHYLYRVPEGYTGSGKRVWNGQDGGRIADIKAKGYIVGPGSTVGGSRYTMINDTGPITAPEWLLDFCVVSHEKNDTIASQCDGIPNGEHDSFLHKEASWLRGTCGLSEEAILEHLRKGPLAVLQGTDSHNPYTDDDLKRIAHSAGRYAAEKPLELIESPEKDDKAWISAYDLPDEQEIVEWVHYLYVPQNKLTLQYGTGGIGKSTWIAYLVGTLIKKGLKVGFSATEESFDHFVNGVRLSLGKNFDKEMLRNLSDIRNFWKFSRDEDELRAQLETCPLDFIYFDSIYDTFNVKRGLTEDTRPSLTPLSKIAEECKVTILGTFHENKSGEFNGSKDMESVPRCLIHATSDSDGRLRLHVRKANRKKPNYDLLVNGSFEPETNPNGTPVMERLEDGSLIQTEIFIVTGFEKVEKKKEGTMHDLGTIQYPQEDEAMKKVKECREANPDWGRDKIAAATGLGTEVVKKRLKELFPS